MARIFIVDDSADLTEILSTVLRINGHQPFVANLNESIYRQLEKVAPDLILLDILLHGKDGRQLCHDLKCSHLYKNLPVILVSANPQLLRYYKDFKADDFIEKPFDLYEVVKKVTALTT
jgi:DNA-binding response OmpR family regulator